MARDSENSNKDRKSGAQEIYEQADNAGRFAGDDAGSKAAEQQASENNRQDTESNRQERNKDNDFTDAEARRDPAQSQDYKGEAQNVNDDTGRPLNEQELDHSRNKANEDQSQNRDNGNSSTGL